MTETPTDRSSEISNREAMWSKLRLINPFSSTGDLQEAFKIAAAAAAGVGLAYFHRKAFFKSKKLWDEKVASPLNDKLEAEIEKWATDGEISED